MGDICGGAIRSIGGNSSFAIPWPLTAQIAPKRGFLAGTLLGLTSGSSSDSVSVTQIKSGRFALLSNSRIISCSATGSEDESGTVFLDFFFFGPIFGPVLAGRFFTTDFG